ncbi:MAG: hypothetical protein HC828_03470 [Blastochloris sp.]|nr:hypothetical protein [Blastochloris sp.]
MEYLDPLQAPTAPQPYGYYADLAPTHPFAYNATLQLWVAASASVVHEVLTHPLSRVRPPEAPIPPALLNTPLGDLFGRLLRMRDGAQQCSLNHQTATVCGGTYARRA